ncbi:MAG: hypothetical protein L0338_22800, partial [Acidobacteria bacterium]|nr:hypothetical protein [Acidobacteriota bacterium]
MFSRKQLQTTVIGWFFLAGIPRDEGHRAEGTLFKLPASSTETTTGRQERSARPATARETLFGLRDRLQRIAQKLRAPDARQMSASALADVNFMIRGWTPGSKVPQEYSTSLELSLRLLDQALTTKEEGHAFSALRAAADDLHIKAEHCRKSGAGLGGMVTLLVRTRSGDREQRNLQVLYLPKLLEAA